ncbi:hypothetical protein THRCLA_00599 [Thraustotheca clavata]|uniref:Uncharacterized protein n=1 Tax=Thraustotheca clavata TaxID=74557 RepID=A0A1W0AAQ4_9STRA|nr:hypothetical protein THRCLA_00599 [Thraustotheca clavata]
MSTKNFLQRAVASQRLRGVLVDYEALCTSTLHEKAKEKEVQSHETVDETLAPLHQPTMFQNMRNLLQNMTKSETEHGRRIQQTLAGLPQFMQNRVLGSEKKDMGEEDTMSIEEQLQEKSVRKSVKAPVDVLKIEEAADADSPRAKYLDKMNVLKKKAKMNKQDVVSSGKDSSEDVSASKPSVLPTRKVNEGANEFLSYVDLRGLALSVIPPLAEYRQDEFHQFVEECDPDGVMSLEQAKLLPNAAPIEDVCTKMELLAKDIVVITSSENAISSAKAAGSLTCFLATKTRDSHYDCDFSIPNLREFKYVVEELNVNASQSLHLMEQDSLNEAAQVRAFYDDLCNGNDGLTINDFFKPLYFLQHATFTLVDAKAVYDLVKGKNKMGTMSLREYAMGLAKIAKIRYVSTPRTLSRLLADMNEWRKKAGIVAFHSESLLKKADTGFDTVRLQMLLPGAVEILSLYNHTIANAYHMYRGTCQRIAPITEKSLEIIPFDGVIDFLAGYFVHPEFISTEQVKEYIQTTCMYWHRFVEMNTIPSLTPLPQGLEMHYAQFLEFLCRVSHHVHLKLLHEEQGHLRKHIETSRLDHSLKALFDHMQFDPHVAVIQPIEKQIVKPSQIESMIQEIHSSLGALSERTSQVLKDHLVETGNGKEHKSWHDVVVIRDVLAIPSFSSSVRRKLECAFEYQNNGQFQMAWSMLHEAENELTKSSRFNVLDPESQLYFALIKGGIYESQKRDTDALHQYMEALGIVEGISEKHLGRSLVWNCLGGICYFIGSTLVALKCFDRALYLCEESFGNRHADTATALNNLACCFYTIGSVDHAIIHFNAALSVFQSSLATYHPRIAVVKRNVDMARRHQTTYFYIADFVLKFFRFLHDAGHVKSRGDLKYIIPGIVISYGIENK